MGIKLTSMVEIVGTQDTQSISFQGIVKNRLQISRLGRLLRYRISASEGRKKPVYAFILIKYSKLRCYHVSKGCVVPLTKKSNLLYPFFQYHMNKTAKDHTSFFNPGQCTVGSADQSLFAIKKKIQ